MQIKRIWSPTAYLKIVLPGIMLIFLGCGNLPGENEYEQKITQAQEALDQEKFSEAISILNSLEEKDPKVGMLKSMAYAGRAGLRSLEVVDIIERNNRSNPGVIISFLAKKYGSTDINDSREAIEVIRRMNAQVESRSNQMNLLYAIIQIYKASQIILQKADLAEQGRISEIWDPCLEAYLLSIDIQEIVASVNRALQALAFANQDLYSKAVKIQEDLKINAQRLEAELVTLSEVHDFRVYAKQYLVPRYQTMMIEAPPVSNPEDVCPQFTQ